VLYAANCIIVAQSEQHKLHGFILSQIQKQLRKNGSEQHGVGGSEVFLTRRLRTQQSLFNVDQRRSGLGGSSSQHCSLHVAAQPLHGCDVSCQFSPSASLIHGCKIDLENIWENLSEPITFEKSYS
jgi:hypothetical protein